MHVRCTEEIPLVSQPLPVKVVLLRHGLDSERRQIRPLISKLDPACARADDGPAFLPRHRCDKSLSAQILMITAVRSGRQKDNVPGTVLQLHQIRMSRIRDSRLHPQMALRQDRIAPITLVRTRDLLCSGNGLRMKMLRSAFRDHQIIVPVHLVQMRRLRPRGILHGAAPDLRLLAHQLKLHQINLRQPYHLPLSRPAAAGSRIVSPAVVIPEQGRVNALRPRDPVRVRPRPFRLLCRHDKVAAVIYIGGDHVKKAFMITDRRRKNASGDRIRIQGQLLRPVQHMPDLLPVRQIPAVENGDSRIIRKGRSHHIEIVPHPADGGIGIKSR